MNLCHFTLQEIEEQMRLKIRENLGADSLCPKFYWLWYKEVCVPVLSQNTVFSQAVFVFAHRSIAFKRIEIENFNSKTFKIVE